MKLFYSALTSLALAGGFSSFGQDTDSGALEEVTVTATPLNRTLFEQAQPVTVLGGDQLRLRLEPTLGETLSAVPGVSSTYFGPASSRPVIRGLDGDRVRVLQNGSNTVDASATSVDHAVSFDPVSAQSIEVVRGPATLLYGPNAIGGVVNTIDGRIPESRLERPLSGSVEGRWGSVNTERGGAFTLEGGWRGWNWHLEGYKRATDELHIPGEARSARLQRLEPLPDGEKEQRDVLPNSDLRTEGLSGGLSYVWDKGFIGAAYSGFHTNYGTVAERNVTIDMEQRRWDVRGAFFRPMPYLAKVKYSVGISDYEHTEFEGALAGTRFENEGYDTRVEIEHEPLGPFTGTLGYQGQKSDFSALGEEAFLPPVETESHSAFLFEEWTLSPRWRLQFGARYDHVSVAADAQPAFGPGTERTFDNASGSAGIVFNPAPDYAVALNLAFTQRAPTYQELFANGPHVATAAFEIGDAGLQPEKSWSADLSLRKKAGRITGGVSLFYNRFTDFIGQFANGAIVPGEEEDLRVFLYRATDAEFFGGEAELTWHVLEPPAELEGKDQKDTPPAGLKPALDLIWKGDYVHATDLKQSRPLPRIPPFRTSVGVQFSLDQFSAGIEGQYSARQNRTSEFELPTDSYFLLNATANYHLPLGAYALDVYVKGVNLTDAEARLHTSFLKEIAPLAGRGVVVGVKATF